MTETPLISDENLSVHFPLGAALFGPKLFVRAVDNVSIDIAPGTFFGNLTRATSVVKMIASDAKPTTG